MINKSRINSIKGFKNIFDRAPNSLQSLYPCIFATPLNVAHYFNNQIKFDIMIIDEASQMTVLDSLPGILYSDQIVVVGDPKQMSPSKGFNASLDISDDGDSFDDSESVLDFFGDKINDVSLLWHYRSLHPQLIEFSNHRFYNSDLIYFPSNNNDKSMGVFFNFVENGRFINNINTIEAHRVIDIAKKLFKNANDETIGIITMNKKQADYIENILIKEEYLNKQVFVKNIENMQGDEADNIIISMTYGKNEDGVFYKRFGPINNLGGDKRLNVLFTRARKRMIVACSFKHNDLNGSIQPNVSILKDFLHFAENKKLQNTASIGSQGDCESPFETSVKDFLTEKGYSTISQLGVKKYRIDLVVVDTNNTNKYLLAIECDGASYHSSSMARERDYTRQKVLENLGWTVYRIWSTDWLRDPAKEKRKLINYLKDITNEHNYDSDNNVDYANPNINDLIIESNIDSTETVDSTEIIDVDVPKVVKNSKTYIVSHKFDFSDDAIDIIECYYLIYLDSINLGISRSTLKSEKEFYYAVKGVDNTFTCNIASICYEYHTMLKKRNDILKKQLI